MSCEDKMLMRVTRSPLLVNEAAHQTRSGHIGASCVSVKVLMSLLLIVPAGRRGQRCAAPAAQGQHFAGGDNAG